MTNSYFRLSETPIEQNEYALIRLNLMHSAGYRLQPHPDAVMDVIQLKHPKAPFAELFADGDLVVSTGIGDRKRFAPDPAGQANFERWIARVRPHWFTKARRDGVLTTLVMAALFVLIAQVLSLLFG